MSPKKPNSAQRYIIVAEITALAVPKRSNISKNYHHNKVLIRAYVPGISPNLNKFSKVLIIPKRKKDLPGINYTVVKGKFDYK